MAAATEGVATQMGTAVPITTHAIRDREETTITSLTLVRAHLVKMKEGPPMVVAMEEE